MKLKVISLVSALMFSGLAAAGPYSLAGDFSEINNPNGPWSFKYGGDLLGRYNTPSEFNDLNVGLSNGWWGVGASLNSDVPFVGKTTVQGWAVNNYSNFDFLPNQVIIHSPNTDTPVYIHWTAPSDGTIDLLESSFWYAQSSVDRVNEILPLLAGSLIGPKMTTSLGLNEQNRVTLNLDSLSVSAGDVLTFEIARRAGQQYGSITGADINFTFNPTSVEPPSIPEPATYALVLAGLLGTIGFSRRKL